jgi:hypothetical protein
LFKNQVAVILGCRLWIPALARQYYRGREMNIFTRNEKQKLKSTLPGIERNLEENVLDI